MFHLFSQKEVLGDWSWSCGISIGRDNHTPGGEGLTAESWICMDYEVCGTYHIGVLRHNKCDYETQVKTEKGGEFG